MNIHLEYGVRVIENDWIVCDVVAYSVYNSFHRLASVWSQ